MLPIEIKEIERLFSHIEETSFGVIGDFCLDVYLIAEPCLSEESLETGLETIPIWQHRYSPGGAGNVARNLISLGAKNVRAYGVYGADIYGRKMTETLTDAGVNTEYLKMQDKLWDTNTYVKVYENGIESRRIDFGCKNELEQETSDWLLDKIESSINGLNVVIINEQLKKGLYSEYFRKRLNKIIEAYPDTIFICDSRDYSDEFNGTYRKINEHEGALLCGWQHSPGSHDSSAQVKKMSEILYKRWRKPVFITRGAYGCAVYDENGYYTVPGLRFFGATDTVGAGDSFLAALAAALAAGAVPAKAAALGNLAAGVTVQKLIQTGTASQEEILYLHDHAMYRFRPELAASPSKARYLEGTEIEIVTGIPKNLSLTHAVFDNDGTVSTLREGWEKVMEPMMVEQIFGDYYLSANAEEIALVTDRVRDYIDKTTGVQTLVQMKGLIGLVAEFGYVPRGKILNEKEYKEIYNRALLKEVNKRIEKLKKGELDVSDYTVKNAVSFLEELKRRGTALYLASGTDQNDVENEAGILGFAGYFKGHIYGSTGKLDHEPKRKVMERILSDIGQASGERVAVFGDGPVEIREACRAGVFAVGVASDEVRRHGLNTVKRKRLIEAGADIVISDYSQIPKLLNILF